MEFKRGTALKSDQTVTPILHHSKVSLPIGFPIPSLKTVDDMFTGNHSLKTWGRKVEDGKTILLHDPHYIGVRGSTPMHTDPKYPRYSYHLLLMAMNCAVRGVGTAVVRLKVGSYILLDAWSPHQLFGFEKKRPIWYMACSIDSHEPLNLFSTQRSLVDHVRRTNFKDGFTS